MYKYSVLITSLVINATDNNNAQIPQALDISFYNAEIAKLDKQLEPLKKLSSFEDVWKAFERSYFRPEWIKEAKKLQSTRMWYQQLEINPSLAYIGLSVSDTDFMKKYLKQTLESMKNEGQQNELIHAKKIDYELKREFLKKFESKTIKDC